MGCSGSVSKTLGQDLQDSRKELGEERGRLQAKDETIVSLRTSLRDSEQASRDRSESSRSLELLRSELQARQAVHDLELHQHRESLTQEHRQHLSALQEERLEASQGHTHKLSEEASARRALELAQQRGDERQQALLEKLQDSVQSEVAQYRRQAEDAERDLRRAEASCTPLRAEHGEAAEALAEARGLLRSEQAEHASSAHRVWALERQLASAQDEFARAEHRYAGLEKQLRAQLRDLQGELRAKGEELQRCTATLQHRDQELLEVGGQLTDLQLLFEEVNLQLQSECGRVEKLQGSIASCAQQSRDLEVLQGMLEESHRMLAQVRDALEQEQAERRRAAGLLEHEKRRAQLLLDVLKHFKEKLQGLTPQMLLSRLGGPEAQALLAGVVEEAAIDGAAAMNRSPFAPPEGAALGARGVLPFQPPPAAAAPAPGAEGTKAHAPGSVGGFVPARPGFRPAAPPGLRSWAGAPERGPAGGC